MKGSISISGREIFLLVILGVMLIGIGYYFLYFAPTMAEIRDAEARVSEKESAAANAVITVMRWAGLSLQKENIEQDFSDILNLLPESFDETDILRRIEKIVGRYTPNINIIFPREGARSASGATSVYGVNVDFIVSYDEFQEIIKAFAGEDIPVRIVNFSCQNLANAERALLQIRIALEFLAR